MGKVTDHVRKVFNDKFPFSLISNIILYRGDRNESDLYANEIDFLFHYLSSDQRHHLVIIEVKEQSLSGQTNGSTPTPDGPWLARYGQKSKDVKEQISDQIKALKQFCQLISKNNIDIEGWIIDDHPGIQSIQSNQNITVKLLTKDAFSQQIKSVSHVFRIEHSEFLRELRCGMALPDTGHPEIPNAIRFIQKCRENLDSQLYNFFDPKEKYYAINGCAGMGKSVLLAYGLYVLATDHCIKTSGFDINLTSYEDDANRLKWPRHKFRKIYAFAVKEKQIKALKTYYEQIKIQISNGNPTFQPAFQVPQFAEWKGNIPGDCNCLVIDESHDLSLDDQKKIASWIKQPDRFLIVACDRNQAVKRKEDEQYIIQGIDFSRHTRRLNRIYRCPFPVYVAAVGLLFRWFAKQNIAVSIHTNQELSSRFGFKTIPRLENHMTTTFSMRNDCHPGNNWQQTVSYFNRPERAYDYISQFAVKTDDVLWACFKKTSAKFDYSKIQRQFIWVDLTSEQAEDEIDKRIKGQEFPIVFVEGLPPDMNPPDMVQNTHGGPKQNESERKMWQARKNLYIVCSRASAFLYFVSKIDSKKSIDISVMELKELIHQVSQPVWNEHESGKTWTFTIKKPTIVRYPSQFKDFEESVVGHPINKFPEVKKQERAPIKKIIHPQTKRSNHPSIKNPLTSVKIANIPFESNLRIRLRHIYGVLFFMKQGHDFSTATHYTLKLFPEVKDYNTISDKCARRFSGNVNTFISWFDSGQMLNKLHVKFSLSDHDYEIFKKLLKR